MTRKIMVIGHQKISYKHIEKKLLLSPQTPVKIAFLGYQAKLKGWRNFVEAVNTARKKQTDEKFYQFGFGEERNSSIKQIDVDFRNNMNSMTDKLVQHKIDCAVIYSLIPETYSFTYYEASASGCFIITNSKSGNVCKQVLKNNNGIVTENLEKTIVDEAVLRNMINEYRKQNKPSIKMEDNDDFVSLLRNHEISFEKIRIYYDLSFVLSLIRVVLKKVLKK